MKYWIVMTTLFMTIHSVFALQAFPQSEYPVAYKIPFEVQTTAGAYFTVSVSFNVEAPWYIYAPTGNNASQGMIETNVIYQLPKGITRKGKMQLPKSHFKGGFEVYEGKDIVMSQEFEVGKDVLPGTYKILAKVAYQSCNEKTCLPPMMDEVEIAVVVKAAAAAPKSKVKKQPKVQTKAALAKQNNSGHPANDFRFTQVDGRKKRLYGIDAKYTLLFFYNPECDACKEYKALLLTSVLINDGIKKGLLKVLAVYIDKDVAVWKKHLPEMPRNWIHGRDEKEYLYKNGVYDLHTIPTIYLLDRNKKVILKDVLDVVMIEKELK